MPSAQIRQLKDEAILLCENQKIASPAEKRDRNDERVDFSE
jgi:hypothetical protein